MLYGNELVSKNSELYRLLNSNDKEDQKKVKEHAAKLESDFRKYWPKEYDHLRYYKIGSE